HGAHGLMPPRPDAGIRGPASAEPAAGRRRDRVHAQRFVPRHPTARSFPLDLRIRPRARGPTRRTLNEDSMLKLRNLEKSFDTKAGKIFVLRRIDLDVRQGEFVTIMGPSGAGKSTLLGIVGMLDGAWNGEYWFLDQPVHR